MPIHLTLSRATCVLPAASGRRHVEQAVAEEAVLADQVAHAAAGVRARFQGAQLELRAGPFRHAGVNVNFFAISRDSIRPSLPVFRPRASTAAVLLAVSSEMHDLDVILASIRHQREDLERQITETTVRGGETSALLDKLEDLRRRLPQEEPAAKTGEAAAPPPMLFPTPDPPVQTIAGKRLLVADDDAAMLRLFQTLARREGLECDVAANGAEAVAALKARAYSMLFLDIMMPRIDGWGVLDYLRTHPTASVGSLFIITAYKDQTVSAADRGLVSGIIYKPIEAAEMGVLMRRCVRGESAIGALQNTRHRLLATTQ
jgi:CheY-like chemotaxis protein